MSRRGHKSALAAYARWQRRRNLAPATCELQARTARIFLREIKRPLRRLGKEDVRNYLAARSLVLSPAALVGEASRVRGFLAVLVREGLLERNPAEGLTVPVASSPRRPVISERAVSRILLAASEVQPRVGRAVALRDRANMEIAYGLGLRASELRAIRAVDLDAARGELQVRPAKRGPPRVLPLPRAALPHLERYLREGRPRLARRGDQRGYLLLSRAGNPLRVGRVQGIVRRAARRAGYEVRPHDLRHALASHLARGGVSVLAIADLLGHASAATTQGYLCLELEDLRRAVQAVELAM